MDVLIAVIGMAGILISVFIANYFLSGPKPLSYDVNKVRELEMEIWGYYFTPLPETEKPKALPKPPGGSGGGSGLRLCAHPNCQNSSSGKYCQRCRAAGRDIPKCKTCAAVLVSSSMDSCHNCTKKILEQRRFEREKASYQPCVRFIEHQGITYKVTVPSQVPDNAHAEIMGDPMGSWADFKVVIFKWTDQGTGKQMFLRATAHPADRYEVRAGDGSKREFYA